jgi:hypothetical protein
MEWISQTRTLRHRAAKLARDEDIGDLFEFEELHPDDAAHRDRQN